MPLLNVNMPCPLLFWLVFIGLFHCRASSPAQYTLSNLLVPPPAHEMTSPGFNDVSRDKISLIITQYLGLPPLYSHPTIHLSVHYTLKLFHRPRSPLLLSVPDVLDDQFSLLLAVPYPTPLFLW